MLTISDCIQYNAILFLFFIIFLIAPPFLLVLFSSCIPASVFISFLNNIAVLTQLLWSLNIQAEDKDRSKRKQGAGSTADKLMSIVGLWRHNSLHRVVPETVMDTGQGCSSLIFLYLETRKFCHHCWSYFWNGFLFLLICIFRILLKDQSGYYHLIDEEQVLYPMRSLEYECLAFSAYMEGKPISHKNPKMGHIQIQKVYSKFWS